MWNSCIIISLKFFSLSLFACSAFQFCRLLSVSYLEDFLGQIYHTYLHSAHWHPLLGLGHQSQTSDDGSTYMITIRRGQGGETPIKGQLGYVFLSFNLGQPLYKGQHNKYSSQLNALLYHEYPFHWDVTTTPPLTNHYYIMPSTQH